ncbi:MAG: hypothetical protein LBU24_00405 [Methanocalculaceae archaeon]|jgi:hypothetical protein|nr:hypothetical protein [Methanocalculaceae archaeon]
MMNRKPEEGAAEYAATANLVKEDVQLLSEIAEPATEFQMYDEVICPYIRVLEIKNANGDEWAGIAYAFLMMEKHDDTRAFFEMAKATASVREIPLTDKLHKSHKTVALDQAFT